VSWGKVDDLLHSHRKTAIAGVEAMGLWVLSLSWACGHESPEGHIPRSIAVRLVGSARKADALAGRLVAAGLWHPMEDGWTFHDWGTYQRSRADREAMHAQRAAAGRRGAEVTNSIKIAKSLHANPANAAAVDASSVAAKVGDLPSRPVPSQPIPVRETTDCAGNGSLALALSPPAPTDTSEARSVNAVFARWCEHRAARHPKGPQPVLDDKRRKLIRQRLHAGHDVDVLLLAVEGIWKKPFNIGENEDRREYTSIELALRDAEHIEDFAQVASNARRTNEQPVTYLESRTTGTYEVTTQYGKVISDVLKIGPAGAEAEAPHG
jgi:hypothetical protein